MALLSDRIRAAMKAKEISQAELARQSDVTRATVNDWVNGRSHTISGQNLFNVANILGVAPEWLSTGQPQNDDSSVNISPVAFKQTAPVPLLSWVQAGNWAETDAMTAGDAQDWMLCPVPHGDQTFILRVRGASMEPEYRDGDWIFVDPARPAENGAHVIVLTDDDKEATFKKLVIEGDSKYLEALNPEWPDRIIKINGNASILGVVIFSGKPRG